MKMRINIQYDVEVNPDMYPEGVNSTPEMILYELHHFDYKLLMAMLSTEDYKYTVETAPEPKKCIGFAEYEGNCKKEVAAGAKYFCARCEQLRINTLGEDTF